MNTDQFFQKIRTYTDLGAEAEYAWQALLRETIYRKGDHFIRTGQTPQK